MDHRQACATKPGQQLGNSGNNRAKPRDVVAKAGPKPAGLDEIALHVDDD
jgi:hypothetical protein